MTTKKEKAELKEAEAESNRINILETSEVTEKEPPNPISEVCSECCQKYICYDNGVCDLTGAIIIKPEPQPNLETSPGLERANIKPFIDTCCNCHFEIQTTDDYRKHFDETGHGLFATSNGKEMKFD